MRECDNPNLGAVFARCQGMTKPDFVLLTQTLYDSPLLQWFKKKNHHPPPQPFGCLLSDLYSSGCSS